MAVIEITAEEGAFADMDPETTELQMGERRIRINYLTRGTTSGLPSVAMAIQKDDGSWFVWETTARALFAAAGAIQGFAEREGVKL